MDFDKVFDWCVQLLIDWAHFLGMTYNEINVWIFVIIEPIVFVMMVTVIIWQYRRIKRLSHSTRLRQPR